jgi:glycosyltransferase involved in cell wall biosynthesis
MNNLPSISIVTVSYNPDPILFRQCLHAIAKQDYQKERIEHIVLDAGSSLSIIDMARKSRCKVFVRKDLVNKAEQRQYMGAKLSKNEILLFLETDNILPDPNWLRRMVEPFEESSVFCTFSTHNCVHLATSLLARYCSLFGVSDPVLYYLGKSEKMSWHKMSGYDKGKIISDNKKYCITQFSKDTLPVLGDNGCMMKRSIFNKTDMSQQEFVHLDLFSEFLGKGFDTCAAVYTCIFHDPGKNLRSLVKRRLHYSTIYTKEHISKRKYQIYNPTSWKDRINVIKFCIFTVTLIEPIVESIVGFIKKREPAWFLHIVVCWIFLINYVFFEIKHALKNTYEKIS